MQVIKCICASIILSLPFGLVGQIVPRNAKNEDYNISQQQKQCNEWLLAGYHASFTRPIFSYFTPSYVQLWSDVQRGDEQQVNDKLSRNNVNTYIENMRRSLPLGLREDNSRLLHWAVVARNLNIVRALLRKGSDVDAQTSEGITPLWLSLCCGKDINNCNTLIARGADPNGFTTQNHQKPLHFAAWRSFSEAFSQAYISRARSVMTLIDHGAYIHAKDAFGANAVIDASEAIRSSSELVTGKDPLSVLLNYAGNPNACHVHEDSVRRQAWSPLHPVARSGNTKGVIELLKFGAHVDIEGEYSDRSGTLLEWARREGHNGDILYVLDSEYIHGYGMLRQSCPHLDVATIGEIALGQGCYAKARAIAHHPATTDYDRGHMLFHARRLMVCGRHNTDALRIFISELEREYGKQRMQYHMFNALGERICNEVISYDVFHSFDRTALCKHRDADGNTIEHYMASAPHLTRAIPELFCEVAQHGNHMKQNRHGDTPLAIAQRSGHVQCERILHIMDALLTSEYRTQRVRLPRRAMSPDNDVLLRSPLLLNTSLMKRTNPVVYTKLTHLVPITRCLSYDEISVILSYMPYHSVVDTHDAYMPYGYLEYTRVEDDD